jgi:Fe-Mn family superoxide dismutase
MFENASLEDIIKRADGGIFNNGAQVFNHTFYFEALAPNAGGEPSGELAKKINEKYGSFASFKDEFTGIAKTFFGSGWVWLIKDAEGKFDIIATSNAGNPLRDDFTPIMCIDVWEHAYYLDVQNVRPNYIDNFWKLINWTVVEARL